MTYQPLIVISWQILFRHIIFYLKVISLYVTLFLNVTKLICLYIMDSIVIYCLHTVKWFQELLFNTNSFIFTLLNIFKHCFLTPIVPLSQGFFYVFSFYTISSIHTVCWFQTLLSNTIKSTQHQPMLSKIQNHQTVQFDQ